MAVVMHVILNDPANNILFYLPFLVTDVHMIPCIVRTYYVSLYIYLHYHNITSDIIISRTLDMHIYKCVNDIPILYVLSMNPHMCMYTIYMSFLLTYTVSTLLPSVYIVCVLHRSFYTSYISAISVVILVILNDPIVHIPFYPSPYIHMYV